MSGKTIARMTVVTHEWETIGGKGLVSGKGTARRTVNTGKGEEGMAEHCGEWERDSR